MAAICGIIDFAWRNRATNWRVPTQRVLSFEFLTLTTQNSKLTLTPLVASKGAESMSKKGKIGLSLFAVAMLTLVIGIAASGTFNGTVAANNPSGPAANGPVGAAPSTYLAEGIWAEKAQEKILPNGVRVVQETKHDVSPPLRDIPPAAPQAKGEGEANENDNPFPVPEGNVKDTVVQRSFGPLVMPTPILVFEGIGFPQSTCSCAPPDTNGDVGPNHYVQIVNTAFQIWDKNGTSLQSPRAINTLFAGFGGPCQVQNNGDPIALYDSQADRWFLNQFTSSPPYYQCTAISTTPDPLGTYYRYGFQTSLTDFYDYQKYGVWPDAYYMTANVFEGDGGFRPSAIAFDRTRMLQGLSATFQEFNPGPFYGNILPTDLDGTVAPPAGEPNFFASQSGTNDRIRLWKFHVDFANPGNSTFTGPTSILVAPFDSNLCGGNPCVPQMGTTQKLQTLLDRPMFRLAYRNMGNYENLLLNHSVDELEIRDKG